jgi:hypothetical protein
MLSRESKFGRAMLRICELQNSHHQEHTLDLVEIPEQRALEEAEDLSVSLKRGP